MKDRLSEIAFVLIGVGLIAVTLLILFSEIGGQPPSL
jgi:hypothetical protein